MLHPTAFLPHLRRLKLLPRQPQALCEPLPLDQLLAQQHDLPEFVRESDTAMRYLHLLAPLRWSCFNDRDLTTAWTHPTVSFASFAAACLIKLDMQLTYMSKLREFLVENPALIWLLRLNRVPCANVRWGFDADASLPTARHFTRLLRKMPNDCLQFLLDETVRLLRLELLEVAPHFGETISLDTKHVIAWVKENNPKAYVSERYNKDQQPKGDPDCKLGCKKRHNQQGAVDEPPTPTTDAQPARSLSVGEFYWGYASGVVATQVPGWGEFVLAELTQPFNQPDVSYFQPLIDETARRLENKPRFGAFDAAFDAFYVYEYFHPTESSWQEGFAAVPFSAKKTPHRTFDADGHPLCEAGLSMTLKYTFICRTTRVEHERAHYVCPHLKSETASCPIQHKRWDKGGCTHRLPTSVGARVRHQIDRESVIYKEVYRQRTATERINSQATALGIERPKLRNQHAITNLNTLIYVLINLRALHRIRNKKSATSCD